jgi:large subunit ribosomal protein L25
MKDLVLTAKIRQTSGKKLKALRKKGLLPAVVYGPKTKSIALEVDYQSFEKIYKEAGESSLISLEIDPSANTSVGAYSKTLERKQKIPVLIHEIDKNPLTDKFIHVDFYQVPLTERVEAKVPLIFEGTSLAVKDLGGTFVKNISDLEVKALPQNLPKEIKIDISKLKTFEDHILVRDLKLPQDVQILKDSGEIIARVAPPSKVEEELEKPIEEKIEEVEKVEDKKKKEEVSE